MTNGVMGSLLATLNAGVLLAHNNLVFSAEAHSGATLPALLTLTSGAVRCSGSPVSLRLWANQAITCNYETSTDGTNWHPGESTVGALSASTLKWVHSAERVEQIRLNVTTNANTTDTVFDARVIYG